MDLVPLLLVCGTTASTHAVDAASPATTCPVCAGANAVQVVRTDERCCFCWIPLCRVGSHEPFAVCRRCGSVMPAAAAHMG
jgi:hypothetical protein